MLMQRGVAALSSRMPKVVSPKQHAIADYITLGGFALMAALFWKRNKRAAVASIICAGAEATNTMLTDFPGGITGVISYRNHLRIDMGVAATCSALPNFMGFEDEPEAKYFRALGLSITTLAALSEEKARTYQGRERLRRSA
jgi:hypothetical protein